MASKISLGLDIGTSSIKLVELRRVSDSVMLTNVIRRPIPLGFSDRKVSYSQTIISVLTEIMSHIRDKRVPLAFCFSSQTIFIRVVRVPFVNKEKLKQIVQYEAQQQIPFSLEEVSWDYCIINSDNSYKEEKNAVIVAVKKDLLKCDIEIVEQAGFFLEVIDIPSLALYNSVLMQEEMVSGQLNAILDIGSSGSNLILFEDDEIWVRNLSISGDKFTEMIQKQYNVSFIDAEHIKKGQRKYEQSDSSAIPYEIVFKIMAPVLDSLVSEIQRSLKYYCNSVRKKEDSNKSQGTVSESCEPIKLGKIFLSGGGSKLRGLSEYFQGRLDSEIVTIDPFKNVKIEASADVGEDVVDLGVAVGLAFRNLGKTPVEVNILENVKERKKELFQKKFFNICSLLLIILISGALFFFSGMGSEDKQLKLATLGNIIKGCKAEAPKIKKAEKNINKIGKQLDYFLYLIHCKKMWLSSINEIKKAMGSDIVLDEIVGSVDYDQANDAQLTIGGQGTTFQEVNDFVAKLREIKIFADVKPLSSTIVKGVEEEDDKVDFIITCTFDR